MRRMHPRCPGRARPRTGPALAVAVLLSLPFGLFACADEPTKPNAREGSENGGGAPRILGLVEVTITGIGTGAERSSVISAPTVAELERLRAAREADGEVGRIGSLESQGQLLSGGDGTIQLELLSTGSVTDGARGSGGYRYVWATYRVRNAQKDGTPYETSRQNLSLYAVDTEGTIGVTPVSGLERFDGSPADPALAEQLIPTGAVAKDPFTDEIVSVGPDILQVHTEAGVDSLRPHVTPAITEIFPYSFVVRGANSTKTRELPANPEPDQFDGLVTFAYKVPLQATPAEDPFTIRVVFLAADHPTVRITQSLEEQTDAGRRAIEERAVRGDFRWDGRDGIGGIVRDPRYAERAVVHGGNVCWRGHEHGEVARCQLLRR